MITGKPATLLQCPAASGTAHQGAEALRHDRRGSNPPRRSGAGALDVKEANLSRELIPRPYCSSRPAPHVSKHGQTWTNSVLSVGCAKTATYRSPRFLQVAALVPSAGTTSNLENWILACVAGAATGMCATPVARVDLQTAQRKTP
jgi:hypothetical protein